MFNKKGQGAIWAFAITGLLIILGIPAYYIYSGMLPFFLQSSPSTFTVIIIFLLPIFYIIGLIYAFVSRLRKGSEY